MPTRREFVVAMVAACLAVETTLGTLALIQSVRGEKEQSRNPRDPAEDRLALAMECFARQRPSQICVRGHGAAPGQVKGVGFAPEQAVENADCDGFGIIGMRDSFEEFEEAPAQPPAQPEKRSEPFALGILLQR
jgi:hypothetical protein